MPKKKKKKHFKHDDFQNDLRDIFQLREKSQIRAITFGVKNRMIIEVIECIWYLIANKGIEPRWFEPLCVITPLKRDGNPLTGSFSVYGERTVTFFAG